MKFILVIKCNYNGFTDTDHYRAEYLKALNPGVAIHFFTLFALYFISD